MNTPVSLMLLFFSLQSLFLPQALGDKKNVASSQCGLAFQKPPEPDYLLGPEDSLARLLSAQPGKAPLTFKRTFYVAEGLRRIKSNLTFEIGPLQEAQINELKKLTEETPMVSLVHLLKLTSDMGAQIYIHGAPITQDFQIITPVYTADTFFLRFLGLNVQEEAQAQVIGLSFYK